MNIVYGSELAVEIKEQIKKENELLKQKGRTPCLSVVLVGEDPASVSYIKSKNKACEEVGFECKQINLNENCLEEEVIEVVKKLNADQSIDGILVQLPLPKHINEKNVSEAIDPSKDVDGLHPYNSGKLFIGEDALYPCTPLGCLELLKKMNVKLEGKNAVVVGRSRLVGLPVSRLLLMNNCTVTTCHSKTQNLAAICKQADILIVAIGKPRFITEDFVKEGAYVIDVGINRVDGKLCGDVDFERVKDKCAAITPVPKGVGPMTVTMLLANTLKAYKKHEDI